MKYAPESEPELRRHVGDIISTVISAKLHAIVDVAFGLFLSKLTVENRLEMDFHDLEAFFIGEQKERDKIPYEQIYHIYHEIAGFDKSFYGRTDRFPEVMESYFKEMDLPRVRREESDCFFDLDRKTLSRAPQLKIGGGLF